MQALYEILYGQLVNTTPWGTRVEPLEIASARLAKPYCVFFVASGGREAAVPVRDNARFVVSVKVVALKMADALGGQEVITGKLHNAGRQDVNPRLVAHADWDVTTVTETRVIWLEEKFEGALSIYHAGYQYEIMMEAI